MKNFKAVFKQPWAQAVLGASVLLFVLSTHFQLLVGVSDSLPERLFFFMKTQKIAKGNYVLIEDFDALHHGKLPVVKLLAGVPGDRVAVVDRKILVNGYMVGTLQSRSSVGAKLNPILAQTIPKNKVFVLGTHARSLDSRYAQVGLVDRAQVKGRVYGLI